MSLRRRSVSILLLCFVCCFTAGDTNSDENFPRGARSGATPANIDPAFYMTTDFILQLNELIKHLATYTLDESLGTREAVERAGYMWNRTEAILVDLVKRTDIRPTMITNPGRSNLSDFTLYDALEAVHLERNNFLEQTGNQMAMEIDAIAIIHPVSKSHFTLDSTTVDPAVTRIMHSSVHNLTNVSAQLLRTLERVESQKVKSKAGQARGGTSQVQPSISLFLEGFRRTVIDTERNFQTQADRAVRRIRSHLSRLEQNQQLGEYVNSIAERITSFKNEVTNLLESTYTSVESSMTTYRTMVDNQLSAGLTDLLSLAGPIAGNGFLHRCLKRFVFTYYDQSLAVAKLLYCGEPEKATLEYLVTVAIPILTRAVVSASSATQMDVVCSSGSTTCSNNFYSLLPNQYSSFSSLIQSYTDFINQELMALSQRLDICAQSSALDVEKFVSDINSRFQKCMNTGSVN